MADYLYSAYEQSIWVKLLKLFNNNAYGVAGAMGWMRGESYLIPFTVEQDTPPCTASAIITNRFNDLCFNERGEFSGDWNGRWIDDSIYDRYWRVDGKRYGGGYGLAQWTETQINSRKHAMFEYYKNVRRTGRQISIGCVSFQVEWMGYEMNRHYAYILRGLRNATSVEGAMRTFGQYEDASRVNLIVPQRLNWGIALYNKYSKNTPIDPIPPQPPIPPDPDPSPDPPTPSPSEPDPHRMPIWMMIDYSQRR